MLVEKIKPGILDKCVCKNILDKCVCNYRGKNRLRIECFLLKIGFKEPSFFQSNNNFWLGMQNH